MAHRLQVFLDRMPTGAHRPPVFECDNGRRWVLKLGDQDPDFPLNEVLAAALAPAFGVRTPAWALLECPYDLKELLLALEGEMARLGEALPEEGGLCFGLEWERRAIDWRQRHNRPLRDESRKDKVHPGLSRYDDELLRLFVFDVFIDNMDRGEANPNLLLKPEGLVAIDHGQAALSYADPTSLRYPAETHLAWEPVQSQRISLLHQLEVVEALPDEVFDRAVAAVPESWWRSAGQADAVRSWLRKRRQQLRAVLMQLLEAPR